MVRAGEDDVPAALARHAPGIGTAHGNPTSNRHAVPLGVPGGPFLPTPEGAGFPVAISVKTCGQGPPFGSPMPFDSLCQKRTESVRIHRTRAHPRLQAACRCPRRLGGGPGRRVSSSARWPHGMEAAAIPSAPARSRPFPRRHGSRCRGSSTGSLGHGSGRCDCQARPRDVQIARADGPPRPAQASRHDQHAVYLLDPHRALMATVPPCAGAGFHWGSGLAPRVTVDAFNTMGESRPLLRSFAPFPGPRRRFRPCRQGSVSFGATGPCSGHWRDRLHEIASGRASAGCAEPAPRG